MLASIGLGVLLLLLILAACANDLQPQVDQLTKENQQLTAANQQLKIIAGPPPASLDQYFPPNALAPVYLIEMFNLAGPFSGIGIDLQEQDMANVKANFQAFKTQYAKMAKMVPEWTSRFPQAPVDTLGKAIDSGNPAQIGPAMGGVGAVCAACHDLYLVKVEQKYHWKSFDDIKVTDPISKKELKWADYMMALDGGFVGTFVDLQEGQLDKANQNYQSFIVQYKAMATDGCKQCHVDPVTNKEIPRKYFVDADSMALVDQLGSALSATSPDAAAIGNLSGAIGNEICLKCHLVHLQAQSAKDTWEANADLLK